MARVKSQKREMSLEIFQFLLFFQTLFQYCHSIETVESHNQAFIQTDNHLTYVVGDVNGIPIEVKPGSGFHEMNDEILISSLILFHPDMLDFKEQPVGMPRMEQVVVQNTDAKNNLHLLSISGSTVHFHCSFFQDKIVPPGGNTTFDVVFLARQVGNVENTLYIHTSQGSYKYQVFGVGIPNPYRVRPYLGAKVPINSSFSPLINLHNPHSSPLQVLEMFSSEGDLHLELPSGDKEAPQSLWQIPPFETKTVMKANFIGRIENNHTAFIRIRTDQEQDGFLILPMEVEVTSEAGLFPNQELLDFGILRTLDEPQTLPVIVSSTGTKPIYVSSVTSFPPNDAISIDFRPTKILGETSKQTIAHVTYKASKALYPRSWSGNIVVKSKNTLHKLTIPYQATVLHGSLVYNVNNTHFFSAKVLRNITRLLAFTNTFNFSVVIYNATLPPEVRDYFSILNFSKPVIIKPQETVAPFILRFHPNATQQHFHTVLTLHTNASYFEIPLTVYNGLLKIVPHRPEKFEGQLDFGTMGVGEKRSMLFTVINDNPVDVYIGEFSTDMRGAYIRVLGMEKGNGTTLSRVHNSSEIPTNPLIIKPYHFVVFSLNLTAPEEEGFYHAEVVIITQFQDIFMPLMVRTAEGSLNAIPENIVFERVYPGKIPYKVLQIHSTFEDYMAVKKIAFQPPDLRFYYQKPEVEQIVLSPQQTNIIGKIFFDAKRECREECYVGLPTHTPAGHQWLLGLGLDKDVAETDQYLYTHFQQKWENLEKSEQNIANVTLELDTDQVQGFLFSAQAHLHWPSLVRKCRIKFPLTQIGNMSVTDFIVENPGDVPVLIQILPLPLYPNPQTVIDMLGRRLSSDVSEFVETDDPDVFILPDLEEYNPKPENPVPGFRKYIENSLGIKPHHNTITTILQPGVKIKVRIGFQPKDDIYRMSLVLIRNNLTIIDAIVLQGQGGRGEMKLNNKRPSSSVLQFDITERHLKNCDKKKQSKNIIPNFTVKRTFTLKNTGELPFFVHGYSINESPCEGYGFRVLDCEGFEMPPNMTRKIDIAFTPDFTMSRIRRILTVHTSLGSAYNYTLQATVPPHTLSKCAAALPRPNWEPVLYYSIICVMAFLLFSILVASYFEADRIFVADILRKKVKLSSSGTQTFSKDKVFDLRQIAGISQSPVTKQPPPADKPSPPPRLRIQLPSGHVEHKMKESFISFLGETIKGIFMPKNCHTPKKNGNNNNMDVSSSENEDKSPSPLESKSVNSDQEKTNSPLDCAISEKSIVPQRISKKVKAAKRAHFGTLADLFSRTPTSSSSNHLNEKKQGINQKQTSQEKARFDSNRDKSLNSALIFESTDCGLTSETSQPQVRVEDLVKPDQAKLKNKRKSRNKADQESNSHEHLVTQISRDSQDDRDEISSITTESSNGDGEEKSSSARDSTPEPLPPPKSKRTKSKSRNLEPLIIPPTEDDFSNQGDFELTSKSRAHKRIKVSPKNTFGGDILKPSTLELPYSMETKTPSTKKSNFLTSDKPKKMAQTNQQKLKGDFSDIDNVASSSGESHDSPLPQWDMPSPIPPPDDLSELSLQTEQFAQKHIKVQETQSNNISPDCLTSSSRSSSYSSIVSSGSNGENGNGKVKGGADKRFTGTYNPFNETVLSAAISPNATKALAGSSKLRNAWTSNASPTSNEPGSTFGLPAIQETSRTISTTVTTGSSPDSFGPLSFNYGSNTQYRLYVVASINDGERTQENPGNNTNQQEATGPVATDPSFGLSSDTYDQNLTIMQRLQSDRRRRIREHQLRILKGEDWPGFDVPPMRSESLWDSEYNPMNVNNVWPTTSATQVSTPAGTGLWSTLTNSANSGWNSIMSISSIWSSTPSPIHENPSSIFTAGEPITTFGQSTETVGSFDPFNASANIWAPSAPTNSTGAWSFPPADDKEN